MNRYFAYRAAHLPAPKLDTKGSSQLLSQELKKLLEVRTDLTMEAVAGVLGLDTPRAIYQWKGGKYRPNLGNYLRLALMLDTTVDQLLVLQEAVRLLPREEKREAGARKAYRFDEDAVFHTEVSPQQVGVRLDRLMVRWDVSVDELAGCMGVSQRTVYNWTEGNCTPRLSHLLRLAQLMDVSVDYILRGTVATHGMDRPEESGRSVLLKELLDRAA